MPKTSISLSVSDAIKEEQQSFGPLKPSRNVERESWVYRHVNQCHKCLRIWPFGMFLRKNGIEKTSCPYCGSRAMSWSTFMPTKIVLREDLLMLTYGTYPHGLFPLTSYEELYKFPILEEKDGLKMFISRGWSDPNYGHYVYLMTDKQMWMTTDEEEFRSMEDSIVDCPPTARVFIAGLGLGLILLVLAKSKKASDVTVAEKDRRVIRAVYPRLKFWFDRFYPDFHWRVIEGDAFDVIKEDPEMKYDWAFWDIWPAIIGNDHSWKEDVEKIKKISNPFLSERGKITCWIELIRKRKEGDVN